jgi:hypothetical protein
MAEGGGKRPRQTPMQCWGCKGDHNYRDFPHRKDKVRAVHNVQQVETMEYMGKRVPRIYVALDNNQVVFQPHTIEMEGMINNHALTILIDSRASHSVGVSGSLEEILPIVLCNFLLSLPSLGIPCPMDFSPISGVTHY